MSAALEALEPNARYMADAQPTLVRHCEMLTTAPGGVARLRKLILTLAVRGKLVPQRPSDEPAAVLLERSRSGGGRLGAGDKSNRDAQPRTLAMDNEPFDLPIGWEWSSLAEIGRWAVGSGFPHEAQGREGLPILFAKVSDMNLPGNELEIARTNHTIDAETVERLRINVHPAGTVIFPKIGGAIATNKRRILIRPTAIDNNCLGITPFKSLSTEYLFLLLTSIDFTAYQAGTSVPALSQGTLGRIVVGLPPQAEQSRIVARVNELMRLCDDLEAKGRLEAEQHARLLCTLLGTLTDSSTPEELAANWQRVADHFDLLLDRPEAVDALEQTILQLAVRGLLMPQDENDDPAREVLERIFSQRRSGQKQSPATLQRGDPVEPPYTLPSQWSWARLGDLVENMGSGWSPACEEGERADPARWAVLRTTAVQVMKYRAHEHKAIPLKLMPRPEIEVKPGDILVTRAGPMNRVGISCWVEETPARLMLSDKIVRFHPVSDELSPAFVVLALNAGWTRELLEAAKTGMAASQVNVSQSDLKSLWVPVCSQEEQTRILARVTELRHLCADLRQRLDRSSATQAALAEALIDQALAA